MEIANCLAIIARLPGDLYDRIWRWPGRGLAREAFIGGLWEKVARIAGINVGERQAFLTGTATNREEVHAGAHIG